MQKPVYLTSNINFLRNNRSLIIAHRGRSAFTPESSYQSFKEAFDLKVDVLEIDVRLTKDKIPIVFHDETLERTTNGSGAVISQTYEQIQHLNLGYWFRDDKTGEYPFREKEYKPLSLSDFFEKFPGIRVNIDIKDKEDFAPEIIYNAILEANSEDRVLVGSFHNDQLKRFRKLSYQSKIPTSASPIEVLAFVFHKLFLTGRKFCALQVPIKMYGIKIVTEKKIQRAHKKNIAVHVWTVNDELVMRNLLKWNVDGIFTDTPDLLLKVHSSIS